MSTHRLAVRGLLVEDGAAYLIHERTPGNTYWWLPGGGVEPGETLEDAIRRELDEELGVHVTSAAPEPIGTFAFEQSDGVTSVSLVYPVEFSPPETLEMAEDTILAADWFEIDAIATGGAPTTAWLSEFFDQYVSPLTVDTP